MDASLVAALQARADELDQVATNGDENSCRELMRGTAQLIRRAFPVHASTKSPRVALGGAEGGD